MNRYGKLDVVMSCRHEIHHLVKLLNVGLACDLKEVSAERASRVVAGVEPLVLKTTSTNAFQQIHVAAIVTGEWHTLTLPTAQTAKYAPKTYTFIMDHVHVHAECQNMDVQLLTTHQTGRVVFLLACLALELGQVAGGAVNDGEADHALLHALELLVNVTLPQQQAVGNRAVLKEDIDE